ncbi:phage major tail tube protein [Cupriavidus nantongensis]|uniref:Phage tail protein n=1 Tax=Cupriavidus nantongensis TaxID=1796606 RepID=A0A142JGT3_9BURK|nr:phage major tail tube protein [Cupriavidus nantongensis]AMR77295.1 phage tail protein [Cupriavidus nantongensis]
MGLPRKLKDFNLFNDGESYAGDVPELTLPKLSRKMEEYRAGGMPGPIEIDFGNELIVLEWTAGGVLESALKQYGLATHNGALLRFSGAYQSEDSEEVDSVDVVVRGRHKEIDFGNAKPAEDTQHKYTTTCSYYKLTVNGETLIEIDIPNRIVMVGGVDRYARIRKAIGL